MKGKIFVENYNGVLDVIIDHYRQSGQLTDNPHEADAILLWQDVRGALREVAEIARTRMNKPVIVMQHGRGATRDYLPPNNFKPQADMFLLWGESEKQRMLKAGYPEDRLAVVGCPLIPRLKPKARGRTGKNVLFVPVISSKEEPENVLAYAYLKKWESEQLIRNINDKFPKLKQGWAHQNNEVKQVRRPDGTIEDKVFRSQVLPTIPRNFTYEFGLVNVKLTPVHDMNQYQAPVMITPQNSPHHVEATVDMLTNIDVMVCLEEGTMQLLACALDIPVIVADIFRYENYGGVKDYDSIEKIRTNACYWTKHADKLGNLVDHALKNPAELRKHRIAVCENEGGAHLGDANQNAISIIDRYLSKIEVCKA